VALTILMKIPQLKSKPLQDKHSTHNIMEELKKIPALHGEHTEWLNKLAFYSDDLKIMEKRVKELVSRNSSKDILAMAEHFQNQIIIQQVQIDTLKDGIWKHEKEVQKNNEDNSDGSEHSEMNDHKEYRQKIERFEEIFNDLRKELITFLAKIY
jgi:hypothetical protein